MKQLKTQNPKPKTIYGLQDGFTLLEVIFALGILAVGLLGVAKMQMTAISSNGFAGRATIASNLAQAKLEDLMAKEYSSPFTDPDLREGSHVAPNPPRGYRILWRVTNDIPVIGSKSISVSVTWQLKGVRKESTLNVIKAKL